MPNEATHHREWNVARVEQFSSDDGFRVVWLELGPLGPKFAASMCYRISTRRRRKTRASTLTRAK